MGLGVPGAPRGDCFARQCTNLAIKVAPPDAFFVILVALGCRRAPFWLKLAAWASQIPCKIITKIHEKIDVGKGMEKGCGNDGK